MAVRIDTAVVELLRPIARWLSESGVTEVCLNRPGELFIEGASGWRRELDARLDFAWANALVIAVARLCDKEVSRTRPFLSASLPGGERVQAVIAPAARAGSVSLTIRCPGRVRLSMDDLDERGLFGTGYVGNAGTATDDSNVDEILCERLRRRQMREFFELAVRSRKSIALVGATGCGKTTLMRALADAIGPSERVITIEDTHELVLEQPNSVALAFDDAMGVSATDCLKSTMRMRPDRVLVSEVRGGEAFDFLNLLLSGHRGSMTSFHAPSAESAIDRFVMLAKAHPHATSFPHETLCRTVRATIDIIAHLELVGAYRRVGEVIFEGGGASRSTAEV